MESVDKNSNIVAWANIILVVIGGLGLMGGFWAFTDSKFATRESLASEVSDRVASQKETNDKLDLILKTLLRGRH